MTASSGDGLSNGLIRKVVCVRSSTLRISSGCHRAGVANCDALFSSQHFMSAIIDHNGPKTVETYTAQYVAGSLYVELWYEGEPYAALSVCFPELALADDEFAFKTYSENQSLYQQFLEQGVIQFIRFEFCSIGGVPICRLTDPLNSTPLEFV